MSYKDLEIWKLADKLLVEIHEMTLTRLSKFQMFEEPGANQEIKSISEVNNCRGVWQVISLNS
jgi:hypothetical protein